MSFNFDALGPSLGPENPTSLFPTMPPGSPQLPDGQAVETAALKRRIAQLEAEKNPPPKRVKDDVKTLGRMYMRLVELFASPSNLIAALDARGILATRVQAGDPEAQEAWSKYDRDYNSGVIMLKKAPRIQELMGNETVEGEELLTSFCKSLADGGCRARSDDFNRVRDALVDWVNKGFDVARKDEIMRGNRENRGLGNDVVGRLLCPYNLNWDDPTVRANIRNGSEDISEDYYPRVLYARHDGPPSNDLEEGYLKSRLLVLTYMTIFTAPSSTETLGQETTLDNPISRRSGAGSQRKQTKGTNAALMKMDGQVTPRSLAYAAVLLLQNLTCTSHWVEVWGAFSYTEFYAFIVDFFDDPETPAAAQRAGALLAWWNKTIFPNHRPTKGTGTSSKSRARLAAARANKENIPGRF